MTWMLTATGTVVDLARLGPTQIYISDIAHHLSQLNRFTGACSRPYSVAEHSLLVVKILRMWGHQDPNLLLAGLLHDAHEAYCADISAPFKQVLGPLWARHEDQLQWSVLERFRVLHSYVAAKHDIRNADLTALITERQALMPAAGPAWAVAENYAPIQHDFAADESMTWKCWRQAFLEEFVTLNQQRDEAAKGQPLAGVAHQRI